MARKLPGKAAPAKSTAGRRRHRSAVWGDFKYNPAAGGAAATATCRWCGKTLCAGGTNGTSHLSRHIKRCRARAAGGAAAAATCRRGGKTLCAGGSKGTSHLRRHTTNNKSCRRARATDEGQHQLTAAEPSSGEQEEEPFYFVDGINIPELFDELAAEGLVHIDQGSEAAGAGDAHLRPNLPQARSTSSRRFFQKAKERRKTESKKRCIQDGFSQDDQLSAQEEFSFSFGE